MNNGLSVSKIFKELYADYDFSTRFMSVERRKINKKLMESLECNMELIYYPNEVLTTKCTPVTEFDVVLANELDQMKDVMLVHNGVGLAANQIGLTKSMFIIKTTKGDVVEMVNPIIIETEGLVQMQEGCLSYAGIFLPIFRPATVVVSYQDRTGELHKVMAEGLEAREIQHEYEHTQGVSFLSKVSRPVRKAALSKLRKC